MTSLLELIAVVFSGWCVWLCRDQKMLSWPVGIVGIVAFFFLFKENHLYSDMILQIIFLVQSIVGWVYWKKDKKTQANEPANKLLLIEIQLLCFIAGMLIWGIGDFMHIHTDAALPHWDASILVLSVIAQMLMTFRVLESWYFWIIVDIISIGVYAYKGLYLASAENFAFLLMCISGLQKWKEAENV